MSRSAFILALMAAQLLAWRAGDVYLCLHSDGTHCCHDAVPETCGCSAGSQAEAQCEPAGRHCSSDSVCDHGSGHTLGTGSETISGEDCTHVRIAGNAPAADVRSGFVLGWAAARSWAFGSVDPLRIPPLAAGGALNSARPSVRPLSLTVLATVALRC